MTKNILLLGGSGYLGTAVAKRFEKEKDYLITTGDLFEPVSGDKFIKLNILNKNEINEVVQEFDLIINFTGQITSPINTCFNVNTLGMDNLTEAVKAAEKKILQISTVTVYGASNYVDETNTENPETPYAACKAFAEYKIKTVLPLESFCILRLTNLYGGKQEKGLFAYLLKSYLSNRELHFNNDGSMMRYLLNVTDCANAVLAATRYKLSGIYNVPARDKYCVKEIVELIESISGVKFKTYYEKSKPTENIEVINFNSFQRKTMFKPKIKLTDYIHQTFI